MPHIHEKIDFCSETYIVNDNAVLLRKHDKYKIWLPPGGHIELNEDPTEAAIREAKEEVGLDVQLVGNSGPDGGYVGGNGRDLLPPRFVNRHRINQTHEHVAFCYFARSDSREVQQGEREISDQIRWFTKEDLDDPSYGIDEAVKRYAKAALDAVSSA